MNAIDLLERQHREVEDALDRFEDAAAEEKARIVGQVIADLRMHTSIEEEIFYPAVRERMDADDEIDEDLEEHHVVDVLLGELEAMGPGDERYDAKVEVLSELIEHHVEEEEDDLFPEVREAFSEGELNDLGRRMQERAQQLRSGPSDDGEVTRDELYERARELDVEGRSDMTKDELAEAVEQAE